MPTSGLTSVYLEKGLVSKNNLTRVYPLTTTTTIHKSSSSRSLSSLSQDSNASSFSSSISSWDHRIPAMSCFDGPFGREAQPVGEEEDDDQSLVCEEPGGLRRCNWITKSSEEVYVSFHDECWGVPVFSDSQLFELLALSGMLIDLNWAEILKRRELYRNSFVNFDYNDVAKMEEEDITQISFNKELALGENRVRCIVENAKCIQKVAKEFGSFSGYMWGQVNHRPMISIFKHPKAVPLRTPKAEAVSKDMVRRGFRLVGPVIIYSFMQAAGIAMDHLVDCYRFQECIEIAERSWDMTNMATEPNILVDS